MAQPIEAEAVEAEAVEWLWRERIPRGMLSIIAGRPDQGKGLVSTLIAAEVSNMPITMPDGKVRGGRVLYSAAEDSHSIMTKPRLVAAGANLKNILLWRFQIPSMMAELEAIITKKDIDLVVLDPFAAHLSHGVSRHSDNIRAVLNPLTELIERTRTAVVIVEHVLKRVPQNGHPLQAIGGSGSGVVAAARMAFLFGIDPADEDHRVLAPVKHNICAKPMSFDFEMDVVEVAPVGEVPTLVTGSEIEFDAQRLIEHSKPGRSPGRPPDKRAAACEWLTNYLFDAGKPVKAGTVMEDAKQMQMSNKTLRRAAADMKVVRNPPGGGPNCTWELPDDILDVLNAVQGEGEPIGVDEDEASVNVDTDLEGGLLSEEDLASLLGAVQMDDDEEGEADGSEG